MGKWTDIAQWVGPTPNQSGAMREYRGVVLHVMQGSLPGSIAWGKNPDSNVSFHFGTAKDGRCQQLVDTDITAWTQVSGNGHWLSIENEDYSGNPLSAAQVEKCAQIYARAVREYGIPLQITDSPNGYGLGWHGMGGANWGGHYDCPGEPIKAQRQQILDRAKQILGVAPVIGEVDMECLASDEATGSLWIGNGVLRRQVTQQEYDDWKAQGVKDHGPSKRIYTYGIDVATLGVTGDVIVEGAVDLTDEAVAKVADAVVDEQRDRLAE